MTDLSDRTLGHHRILGHLGSGGMGQVYVAEDEKLGRQVALKVLPPELVADRERLQRFEREARTLATLSHPNVVTVHSIEEVEGIRFITMERIEGRTLRQLIPEQGLPIARLFELAIPMVDAIAAAHRKGVTHRDLKPDNVMVDEDGRVKVLDFGLAKVTGGMTAATDEAQATASVTQDGRIIGTVAYMSPEQAQGQAVDHRSDIFSLGVLLFEMATGRRPFEGENNLSVLSSILKDTPPTASEVRTDLPRPLERMIRRALEKRPEDRYQSALDLRKDLEDLRRDIETGELLSLHTSASGLRGPAEPSSRSTWWRPAGMALVVAVVALGATWWWSSSEPSDAVLAPVPGVVDTRPSLAVFYFDNITGDPAIDWLRIGLTDMLVTNLSQSTGIRVLGTSRLYELLEESDALDAARVSAEVIREVAGQAGVKTALVGSFVQAGETLRISVRLQDAASGELISSDSVEGEGDDALFGLVDDLTRRVRGELGAASVAGAAANVDLREVTTDSIEAYRHYAEGYILHERGQDREALPRLEKAVELDPSFGMALAKLAVVHGNLQNPREAEDYARRAFERVDQLPARERYYIQGVYYSKDVATLEQAVEAYGMAVERFPDHTAARNNLAQILVLLERQDEAIAHFEALRRQGMRFPGTYDSLAKAYAWVGRADEGLAVLRGFAGEQPDSVAAQLNLANYLVGLGEAEEALRVVEVAERLDPGNLEAARVRWAAHALKGDWAQARQELTALEVADSPFDRWTAGLLRASELATHGRVAEATAVLERTAAAAEGVGPLPAQARLFLANYKLRTGQARDGLSLARRVAADENADDAAVYGHLVAACALALLDRDRESAEEWEAFSSRLGAWPAPIARRDRMGWGAYLQYLHGEYEDALAGLREVEPMLPRESVIIGDNNLIVYWDAVARSHLALGRPAEAETWFRRVAEADSERLTAPLIYARTFYELGRILEDRGEHAGAREHYRRFVELWGEGDVDREEIAEARRKIG
jgi:serine/threonine protein kinase/tetratricopeptide (TPR) repeat protein